jgi:hypothetical protein
MSKPTQFPRRAFLRIAGGSAVILAASSGATAIGFATTRTPREALAPWTEAGAGEDPRLRALSHAILSPNPHNRQPWLVDLSQPGIIDVFCDRTRLLPETDPFDRQIVIGLGCFLETLSIAAAEERIRAQITPFPEGAPGPRLDDRPVARIRFHPDAATPDPLFAQVLHRRSNKEPFDTTRPVPDRDLAALVAETEADGSEINGPEISWQARAQGTTAAETVARLRDLTWRAHMIESLTPAKMKESVDLMRFGKSEITASPDGIDMGGAFLEALNLVGVLTPETLMDPKSKAFRQGLEHYRGLMNSAMAHIWVVTPDTERTSQIAAGRAWTRINLKATALGLAVHPISQALQEYPEMAEIAAEARRELGVADGEGLQMLARLGYGPNLPPSPRWPLETRLTKT